MRQYLSSLVVVVLGVACGGSTGSDDSGGAGTSAGGSASAGSNHGGSNSAGTTSTAGKASGGGSSAGSNSGGSVSVAGKGGTTGNGGTSSGGTGVVNPDCPPRAPTGTCSADDAGVRCQYDPSTNCLCHPSAPGTFTPCQKVDPKCMYEAPAAPAPYADGGAGGVSSKIALPPHHYCSCSGTDWTCTYGI